MLDFKSSITYYLNNTNWKKSLLIHGRWGIGKTFQLKKFFKELKKENVPDYTHYCFINGYEINKDFDIKKYICNNSYSIENNELNPLINGFICKIRKNYEKLPTFVKSAISGIEKGFKITTKAKSGVEFEINTILSKFFDSHMEYLYESSKIKECIVVIDELDRNTTTDITIIFSKIIDLIENFNIKVIMVTNMDMTLNTHDFQLWSEKVIDIKLEFKNEENPIKYPENCSIDFEVYFEANKEYFFNYRSYQRYLNFEKIIDDEFSKFYNYPFAKSYITRYKEIIFYAIFMNENQNYFQTEKDYKEKKEAIGIAPYMEYSEMENVLDSISSNPLILLTRLHVFFDDNSPDKKMQLINQSEQYLRSKKICHADGKHLNIDNPVEFIIYIIERYSHLLEIIPRTSQSKKILNFDKHSYRWAKNNPDYVTLSFWINELKLYSNENFKLINFFSINLEYILKDYWSLDFFDYVFLEPILKQKIDVLIKPFEEEYGNDSYLIPLFKNILLDQKRIYHNRIIENIHMYSSDFKLNYLIEHTENFIYKLLLTSNDFYKDLTRIKKLSPTRYKKLVSEYMANYPNESDRLLKDYLLKTI